MEKKELTLWIARSISNRLFIYSGEKPHCLVNSYFPVKGKQMEINKELYPEITFENSPKEFKLIEVK